MQEVAQMMDDVGIDPTHYISLTGYLSLLRDKHVDTYYHVLRVGRLASRMAAVANIPGVTPRLMVWAGLLHDMGKTLVPTEILNKTEKFDDADRAAMEPHAMDGWMLLQKIHEYTAHVIVRHHRYGRKPYPEELPALPKHLESKRDMIEAAGRLLALADYYDALVSRKNDRNGDMTKAEKRQLYIRENPGFEDLIEKLEAANVFTFE